MSSELEFFPYRFADHAIDLLCTSDDPLVRSVGDGRRIDATAWQGPDTLNLSVSLTHDPGLGARLVPKSEQRKPPLRPCVRLLSIEGRSRGFVNLIPLGPGEYDGRLVLGRDHVRGSVVLEPVLVRTGTGGGDGYASHAGALVARGAPVVVDVDRSLLSVGATLDVRYASFSTVDDPLFLGQEGAIFLLDLREEVPFIWLNGDVERLREIMDTRAARGHARRVQDVMFATIVTQGWSTLGAAASLRFAEVLREHASAGPDDESPFDALAPWEQSVLNFLAPKMYGVDSDEAIEALGADLRRPSGGAELNGLMSRAVQEYAKTAGAYHGMLELRGG